MYSLWDGGLSPVTKVDVVVKVGQFVPPGGAVYGAVFAHDHDLWLLSYSLVAFVVFWVLWQIIQIAGYMRRDWPTVTGQQPGRPKPRRNKRGN